MEYLKSVVPSQLMAERGGNVVVINPGSANVRIGLAQQQVPLNIPHCVARYVNDGNHRPKQTLQDQTLNCQVTPSQQLEREKAYNIIASLLKIPFLGEDVPNNSFPRKTARLDGYKPQTSRNDSAFTWTNVTEKRNVPAEIEKSEKKEVKSDSLDGFKGFDGELNSPTYKFREYICGEEALKIPSSKPYCLHRPIRRGHLNISQQYPLQQVLEDLYTIWDWVLTEKLHIPQAERNMYSAILVVPETFDTREIKEILSVVLRDLRFTSAVVHQEGLAAVFGNGLSTACVVSMGAQVTSVICIEDGVALPSTGVTLPFGGEDISRCLLWTQRHHQTWPPIRTDPFLKPIELLMLNKLRESYCQIRDGEVDAVAVVHSYEDNMPTGLHKTRLTALSVPPMGVFYPQILVPDEYPPPPRSWFHDYEDMLEDAWHTEFPRRSDMPDGLFLSANGGLSMWENYSAFPSRLKKEDNLGLAEAITSSILSTGRIDLQRKLFCSIQLIGGVAMTSGLVPAMEDRKPQNTDAPYTIQQQTPTTKHWLNPVSPLRSIKCRKFGETTLMSKYHYPGVLHSIPSNEAIDTVEVLQSRTDPTFVSWRGGSILGVLDFGREAWIHREDWIRNGIHIDSGRKYKDSFYLQAQAMCYMNS